MKNFYILIKGALITSLISLSAIQPAHARPLQIPLSIAYGVEPNVMIMLDNSGSMRNTITVTDENGITTTPRKIDVAQDALTEVLNGMENVRFCLSMFSSPSEGAFMNPTMECTGVRSEIDTMVATINATDYPNTWTPLAEAYYDVTKYFRGQSAYFGRFTNINGNTTTYDSPIQYRCQGNSVIVVTDGEPTRDWDNNGNQPYSSINLTGESMDGKSLPNWDGIPPSSPRSATRSTRPFPHFSDGYCGMTGANNTNTCYDSSDPAQAIGRSRESRTIFLDDLALFGFEKDMRVGGTDVAGGSWDDNEYNEGIQNLKTHTIGFGFGDTGSPAVLADAAFYGKGTAAEANNKTDLVKAVQDAILTASEGTGSGGGIAQSAFRFDESGTVGLYTTEFDSEHWAGNLTKVNIEQDVDEDTDSASFEAVGKWNAAEHLENKNPNDRNIFTYDPVAESVIDFTYTTVPDPSVFGDDTTDLAATSKTKAELTIEYLRGDQTYETELGDYDNDPATGDTVLFRERETPLGDIVNSIPTYVKGFNFGYVDESYGDYISSPTVQDRAAMVYVGSNDGMLHAFEDEGETVNEKFAFIPSTVFNSLPKMAEESFNENHQYYVDGKMTVVDAKLDGNWSTVLGSPLGRGFKGLFLLDITDPDASDDAKFFKWEINENTLDASDDPVYSKMGFMINPPKIVRFQIPDGASGGFHDKWVMVVGNGVHSEDADDLYTDDPNEDPKPVIGKASVYFIDLDNGELITEVLLDNGYVNQNDSSSGTPAYDRLNDGNGITSVAAVDVSQNSYIDRLYAADLKGGVWRINYDYDQSQDPADDNTYLANNLQSAFLDSGNPAPIFTAEGPVRSDPDDDSPSGPNIGQPITGEMTVTKGPEELEDRSTVMLFFGTGQYFDLPHLLDSSNLKVQSMYGIVDRGGWSTGSTSDAIEKSSDLVEQEIDENGNTRDIITATIDYINGDLGWYIDLPTYGERILAKPSALFSFISFHSRLPQDADVCALGSDGWAMLGGKEDVALLTDAEGNPARAFGIRVVGEPSPPFIIEGSPAHLYEFPGGGLPPDGSTTNIDPIGEFEKSYSRASWLRVQ